MIECIPTRLCLRPAEELYKETVYAHEGNSQDIKAVISAHPVFK